MKKRFLTAVYFLISIMVFTAGAAISQQRPSVIKAGVTGLLVDGPFFIGREKGYFEQEGIELKLATFASAAKAMAPLGSAELDIAAGGISVSLFNAVGRGWPIVVVASRAYLVPGNDGDGIMVRTDLTGQIKTVKDLKGRTYAINATGSPLVYQLGKILATQGMTLKDINIVTIPFPLMGAAFERKAIEAATEVEPFVALLEAKGMAKRWKWVSDFITDPYMDIGVLFYNKDWAGKQPDLACKFMAAWLKGARDFYQAAQHGPNRREIVSILSRHTKIRDPKLYDKIQWSFMNPNGYVDLRSVEDQQNWYFDHGFIDKKTPVERIVDHKYVDCALKKIGKVEVKVP